MQDHWTKHNQGTPFESRHIGISDSEANEMVKELGYTSIDEVVTQAVPPQIRSRETINLPEPLPEHKALEELSEMFDQNVYVRSMLGTGYYDTLTPAPIQRSILENPSWYTQYTPYQSEIAQGRLEALVNYQTMVADLTGLPIANASLLDEGTGAAEAMNMAFNINGRKTSNKFYMDRDCHPQTLAVVKTRAKYLGIEVIEADLDAIDYSVKPCGVLFQYPGSSGAVKDIEKHINEAKNNQSVVVVAADLLSLCLLKSPGELGADIAVGTTQRFGVPLGYGGPHAGYISTLPGNERRLPGRIVGVSKDSRGYPAYRLALATREQHIRRDKATSNICTSQVLLAIISSMYAVYHGPDGLKNIASRVHGLARGLHNGLKQLGLDVKDQSFFDTVMVSTDQPDTLVDNALKAGFNIRKFNDQAISISVDEKTNCDEVEALLKALGGQEVKDIDPTAAPSLPENLKRTSSYLEHPVFNSHHTETKLVRYIKKLENRDLSLTHSMIPLGSCTMKLNAASELTPITWKKVNSIHPFAPAEQTKGYRQMFQQLESWLAEMTGFKGVSLQPNSGAQGEYAGLLVIRKYHEAHDQDHRNICLIPSSAHGTNPASAAMAGMKVVVVKCNDEGNIDIEDLRTKSIKHKDSLGAMMVTYPSTHGVFEEGIKEICDIVHENGGLVYMDGANLQAQIGLMMAGQFGPDVCHMNLHKTFCIPHGGGGPGVGPIAVVDRLKDFLPNHPLAETGGSKGIGPISAAPWGSASILPISWMYIRMMGAKGLQKATEIAILSANYMAKRLQHAYPVVYTGNAGLVAHECIIDLKGIKKATGIDEADIAKRLMDYGFHAPTVSWPVPASMMIEPTESESKDEVDRFCDAMLSIRDEIQLIESGTYSRDNNPLKNAPHTADQLAGEEWDRPYNRERAAYPLPWLKDHKFWPFTSRIDNAYGDRNLVCSCPPVSDYE